MPQADTHTYTHIHTHTHAHAYIHAINHTGAHTSTYTHTYILARNHWAHRYGHPDIQTYILAEMGTDWQACTHIERYTHIQPYSVTGIRAHRHIQRGTQADRQAGRRAGGRAYKDIHTTMHTNILPGWLTGRPPYIHTGRIVHTG